MSPPGRQRGVALIAAVLVVALAVVLVAALLDTGEATRARSRNSLRAEQTWQLMRGLEAWAGIMLMRDLQETGAFDDASESWSGPMPPLEIPGGRVFGRLIERSGCFNLNALALQPEVGSVPYQRFERLLAVLKLDPAIAAQVLDWIDEDGDPQPGGAEDALYQTRRPPQRAANAPFAHVSELRLLPAVDAKAYARLAPYVCALPKEARINWNFAPPALWMSLHDRITETIARRLARDGRAQYRRLDAIRDELEREHLATARQLMIDRLDGVDSEYFVAEADIVVDGIPYAYASLLRREPTGVRVVARTRGRL